LPGRRFTYASLQPRLIPIVLAVISDLFLIGILCIAGKRLRSVSAVLALIGAPIILLLASRAGLVYRGIWKSAWVLVPIVTVLGVVLVVRKSRWGQINPVRQQQIFLVLSVTAACNLIQFPFVAPIYFCYVAPLVILSASALISVFEDPPRLFISAIFSFYLAYAVLEVTPGFLYSMGSQYSPDEQVVQLPLSRAGGLRVSREAAKTYEELGVLLTQHAHGQSVFATPDCPEVYFLYGFRNPTRTLYDFFDDPVNRTQRILALIQKHNPRMVVLNRDPEFSGQVSPDLRAALERQFPDHGQAGRFEVRWRQ